MLPLQIPVYVSDVRGGDKQYFPVMHCRHDADNALASALQAQKYIPNLLPSKAKPLLYVSEMEPVDCTQGTTLFTQGEQVSWQAAGMTLCIVEARSARTDDTKNKQMRFNFIKQFILVNEVNVVL